MDMIDMAKDVLQKHDPSSLKTKTRADTKTWLHNGLFDQLSFYTNPGGHLYLYLLFRSHIVRGGKSDLYKRVVKEYYKRGDLVCALSYREIGRKTGWTNERIYRYISKLLELRWMRRDRIKVGNIKPKSIYILGETDKIDSKECYLIDKYS